MRLLAITAALAAVAVGQWSEPVTLAESVATSGSGPEFVPMQGDTAWVFWIHQDVWPEGRLMARCLTGDTWGEPELLSVGPNGISWPAGVVDDSGRVLVAYYEGSYPTKSPADQDSQGIYTMTRTDTVWSPPALAQGPLAQVFPAFVRLGKARDGSVGMIWDERSGGYNGRDSVMVSRKTDGGWTPRCCLAPGRYPDVYCHSGSLVPGDSTDFLVVFSRWTDPDTSEIEVWGMNDSLVQAPAVFRGALPMLARGQTTRFLVLTRGDTLLGAENHGAGWSDPLLIAYGLGSSGAALCADPLGWGWVCWPSITHQSVLASYNSGVGWSRPETVATSSYLGSPRIASDGLGNPHCVWLDYSGGSVELRHARRLARPGVEEGRFKPQAAHITPTIVRCVPAGSFVFDAMGRRVTNPKSGVYFLGQGLGTRGQALRRMRKVVIQR